MREEISAALLEPSCECVVVYYVGGDGLEGSQSFFLEDGLSKVSEFLIGEEDFRISKYTVIFKEYPLIEVGDSVCIGIDGVTIGCGKVKEIEFHHSNDYLVIFDNDSGMFSRHELILLSKCKNTVD